MTADFCVAALQEALSLYGTPEIFNADHGLAFPPNSGHIDYAAWD